MWVLIVYSFKRQTKNKNSSGLICVWISSLFPILSQPRYETVIFRSFPKINNVTMPFYNNYMLTELSKFTITGKRTCRRKPLAINISSVVDCLRMIGVRWEVAGATALPAGEGSREEHDDDESGDLDDWQLRTL